MSISRANNCRWARLSRLLARAGLLVVTSTGLTAGCRDSASNQSPSTEPIALGNEHSVSSGANVDIVHFCGNCHPMPIPEAFPRSAWRDEVRRGFDFYYASGRSDLTVPVLTDVVEYFSSRAPEQVFLSQAEPVDSDWVKHFDQHEITIPGVDFASVSHVSYVDVGPPLGRGIVFTDMNRGGVYFAAITAEGKPGTPIEVGNAGHPATARAVDWDQDGLVDFLVADLGSYLPADHKRGRVVWFQQRSNAPGSFERHILQDNVGRVSSIEVADFDSDGNNDLLVAEFGWQSTGSIFWLQRSSTGHPLNGLVKHTIDARAGTIHLPVIDLNGDRAPDFIALISQHHERIEAMINDGHGHFRSETIYVAPDPSYGSSGIELLDFDSNGLVDILFTNGDSFDSFQLKPSHGVRWLENQGTFPFKTHELGQMPGAHRAVTGDIDGDGSMEIVASAFIPQGLLKSQRPDGAEALVIWKQTEQGTFSKHVLSQDNCNHANLTVTDLNGDGLDDLVIGFFRQNGGLPGAAVSLWIAKE